jgi:hypothetical protein
MSYQQNYSQQPQGYYPEGYSSGGGTNPALAIIAAVLGLVAAAALVVVAVDLLGKLEGVGFGDLPSEFQTTIIIDFVAALILLVGVIIVFLRKLAGAFILAIGGLAGIAAALAPPVLLKDFTGGEVDFGGYLEALFKFETTADSFAAVALIASPLALILAVLPPTLKYLRGSSRGGGGGYDSFDSGGFPAQPQMDYGQPQGYPQQPGGYPQQPQQGGYPQQPQQPGW